MIILRYMATVKYRFLFNSSTNYEYSIEDKSRHDNKK